MISSLRKSRVRAAPALLALLVAGCSAVLPERAPAATAAPPAPTASEAAPSPPETPGASASLPLPISELEASGQVAAIGADGNVYLLRHGASPLVLTDDAGPELVYDHLTWSPDGWLSYVRRSARVGRADATDILAIPPGGADALPVLEASPNPYIYGYWAPSACAEGPSCGRFAYLLNDDSAVALHLAELNANADEPAQGSLLGRDSSFYYSWAPSGEQMLWYRGERQLSVYDLAAGDDSNPLPDRAGLFMSPAWSPAGTQLLFARADGSASRVTVADGDERVDLGLPVQGYVHFVWSPDGEHVAYSGGGDPLGPITVISADGGSGRTFDTISHVVAFFWSPDSTRLAVVSLEERQEPLQEARRTSGRARPAADHLDPSDFAFAWHVIEVASGETTLYAQFFPTSEQWYMLRFFDQYAQSHRLWSPDSRCIVYAEQDQDAGRPAVRLIDTTQSDRRPQLLLPGTSAVFAFSDSP